MRFALGIVLLALFAGASAKAQGILYATPYYTVSRGGQVVLLMRVNVDFRPSQSFWVAERGGRWRGVDKTEGLLHQWIDGRSCAALKPVMAGITTLPPMKLAGQDALFNSLPSHLTLTTLRGPAAPGPGGLGGLGLQKRLQGRRHRLVASVGKGPGILLDRPTRVRRRSAAEGLPQLPGRRRQPDALAR